jgi:hypothetical protein
MMLVLYYQKYQSEYRNSYHYKESGLPFAVDVISIQCTFAALRNIIDDDIDYKVGIVLRSNNNL